MDFVRRRSEKTEIGVGRLVAWLKEAIVLVERTA
jgi:hypothetical protein